MPLLFALWMAVATAAEPPPPATLARCSAPPAALPAGMPAATSAVVRLETPAGSGSGVVIAEDGWILTAAHVVGTAATVKVVLADKTSFEGEVVRVHPDADLALVHGARPLPCAPLATSRATPGLELYVIGSPGGASLSHSVSKGIVSAWRDAKGIAILQTDASINGGNSGGPALDVSGSVQGIVSFKAVGDGVEGLGFAIGVDNLQATLGVTVGDAATEVAPWKIAPAPRRSRGGGEAADVTNRPAAPAPAPTEAPCEGQEVREELDALMIKPAWVVSGKAFDMREIERRAWISIHHELSEAANYVLALNTVIIDPGMVSMEITLADGSKIAGDADGGMYKLDHGTRHAWANFELTPAAITALASSPITKLQFRYVGMGRAPAFTVIAELKKSELEALRAGAACLNDRLVHLP